MRPAISIAVEAPDATTLETLYTAAFPDEDLTDLVTALLALPSGVISLTARIDGALAGHELLTLCGLEHGGQAALLGPLAVAPDHQRRGVGSALVRAGIDRLHASCARRLLVLGDPAYYARFGFRPERSVLPPYPVPPAWADAWRSIRLTDEPAAGALRPPSPWDDPALWS